MTSLYAPVRASMHLLVQSHQVDFKVLLVALPCCAVHSRSRFPLETGKGVHESIDRHVVEQSGEPFLLLLLRCFSYTVKPLGHAFPALCPRLGAVDGNAG